MSVMTRYDIQLSHISKLFILNNKVNIDYLIKMDSKKQIAPITYKLDNQWKQATCGECIHKHIGERVDIQWNIDLGTMKLSKSDQHKQISYQKNEQKKIQTIKGAHFYHGRTCPLLNKELVLNPSKYMKPCTCVLLYDKQKGQFLITERSPQLRTYPNAWVLPGGHLQCGQGIFQGGIRQCNEQVGLPKNMTCVEPIKQKDILVWESVFATGGQVKACAIVVFFITYCEQFEVKIDEKQVSMFRWKKIEDSSDQHLYRENTRKGYAEGHLKFLQLIRKGPKF